MKTGGTSLARMLPFSPDQRYPVRRRRASCAHEKRAPESLLAMTPEERDQFAWDSTPRPHEKFDPRTLLAMTPEERDQFLFVSTHMAAWVAEDLFPDYLSVTVLRDPVERTISHLEQLAGSSTGPVDFEEIYENPIFHSRLVNYQVQVFAQSRAEFLAQEPQLHAYDPARHPEPERTRILAEVNAAFATSVAFPKVIDERSYEEAADRLDRVDEVGVTERLGELLDRVGAHLGREVGPLRHDRQSKLHSAVPAVLRERIERENKWDRTLYERALARQPG
jgi:tetrahydromethanopterin S-methyltransferase subunit G